MRLFYALPMGEEDRTYLETWQEYLIPRYRRAGRVYRDNFHLTLRFLGAVDSSSLPGLTAVLEELTASRPPFAFRPDCPGTFPGGRGETVYLGFSRIPAVLHDLSRDLDRLLGSRGYPVVSGRFVPHITLLRNARRQEDGSGREPEIPPLQGMAISRICLMESVSTPEGVRYREVACGHLRGEPLQKSPGDRQE